MADMRAHPKLALRSFKQAFSDQPYGTMYTLTLSNVTGANTLGISRGVMRCH